MRICKKYLLIFQKLVQVNIKEVLQWVSKKLTLSPMINASSNASSKMKDPQSFCSSFESKPIPQEENLM